MIPSFLQRAVRPAWSSGSAYLSGGSVTSRKEEDATTAPSLPPAHAEHDDDPDVCSVPFPLRSEAVHAWLDSSPQPLQLTRVEEERDTDAQQTKDASRE